MEGWRHLKNQEKKLTFWYVCCFSKKEVLTWYQNSKNYGSPLWMLEVLRKYSLRFDGVAVTDSPLLIHTKCKGAWIHQGPSIMRYFVSILKKGRKLVFKSIHKSFRGKKSIYWILIYIRNLSKKALEKKKNWESSESRQIKMTLLRIECNKVTQGAFLSQIINQSKKLSINFHVKRNCLQCDWLHTSFS